MPPQCPVELCLERLSSWDRPWELTSGPLGQMRRTQQVTPILDSVVRDWPGFAPTAAFFPVAVCCRKLPVLSWKSVSPESRVGLVFLLSSCLPRLGSG